MDLGTLEPHTFLIQLVMILLAARVMGEFAAYFQAPPVIGELLAGVLIGPSLLGFLEISPPIHLLAQVGVVLLLFEVGLETDIGRLTAAGLKALIIALAGVILPLSIGFAVGYYFFQLSVLVSIFIGCTLTATSIGITLRVLQDLKKQNSHEAQMILGAAVIDDILGIILLSLLYDFSTSGTIHLLNASKSMLFVVLFMLLAPPAAKLISQLIGKWDKKCEIPGLLPTTIISLILLFAWIAYYIGAPELLGGFAVGLGLSKHFPFPFKRFAEESKSFKHRVEEQMAPLVHFFSPIFFVAIGLSLNLRLIDWHSSFIWIITATLVIAAIVSKLFSAFFLTHETWLTKMIIGTAMIPRGEVGLIFANIGLELAVFKDDIYASIILVIALTTLIHPFSSGGYTVKKKKRQNQRRLSCFDSFYITVYLTNTPLTFHHTIKNGRRAFLFSESTPRSHKLLMPSLNQSSCPFLSYTTCKTLPLLTIRVFIFSSSDSMQFLTLSSKSLFGRSTLVTKHLDKLFDKTLIFNMSYTISRSSHRAFLPKKTKEQYPKYAAPVAKATPTPHDPKIKKAKEDVARAIEPSKKFFLLRNITINSSSLPKSQKSSKFRRTKSLSLIELKFSGT